MNDRERALAILRSVDRTDSFVDASLDEFRAESDSADFVRALVLNVLRWRSRLDHAIESLAKRPIRKLEHRIVDVLRSGLTELWFMQTATHAAVSEYMKIAGRIAPRAKPLVNAILRAATRTSLDAIDPKEQTPAAIATRLGHPVWMFERWSKEYGPERARKIADANQTLSYPDLIVREPEKIDQLRTALRDRDVAFEDSPLLESAVRLKTSTAAVRSELDAGKVYAMDEGSAVIATLMPRRCTRVLDVAAAPGGKSIVLRINGHSVTSNDISLRRILTLRKSWPRMFSEQPRLVVSDGRAHPFGGSFDGVLLDAPCSSTGTIRKNPEVKWRLRPEDLRRFAQHQIELLASALDLTADTCIYSTCSLEREENDEVIAQVLLRRNDFAREDLEPIVSESLQPWIESGVLRLTPESGSDGFTAFALRRKSA